MKSEGKRDGKGLDGGKDREQKVPDPAKIKVRADVMRAAYEKREDFRVDARTKYWVLGLAEMVNGGELDAAQFVGPKLLAKFPGVDYLRTLAPVLETLPPAVDDAAYANFVDDTSAPVQTVRREGASTLFLGFGGLSGKMMIPLTMMHRLIGPANVHVAYIRMEAWSPVHGGPTLGRNPDRVFEEIGKIVKSFAPETVVCQGHSGGGLGGLLTSLRVDVARVLCFSPLIGTEGSKSVTRFARAAGFPPTWSFRDDYEKAERKPTVRLVYGVDIETDRKQAEMMTGVPGVDLEPVHGLAEHESFTPVLMSGRYEALLRELVDGVPAGPAPAGQ